MKISQRFHSFRKSCYFLKTSNSCHLIPTIFGTYYNKIAKDSQTFSNADIPRRFNHILNMKLFYLKLRPLVQLTKPIYGKSWWRMGYYSWIKLFGVGLKSNNMVKNPNWQEADHLAIYRAQLRSWTRGNQEQIQRMAGWRAWTWDLWIKRPVS